MLAFQATKSQGSQGNECCPSVNVAISPRRSSDARHGGAPTLLAASLACWISSRMWSTLSEMLPSGNSCRLMLSILLRRSGSLLVSFFTVGETRKHSESES